MPQHQPASTPVSFTRLAQLLVLSLLALFLTGCLDYKEQMWLKEDGSGKLNATMTLNMQMLEGMGNMGMPADPGSTTTTTTTVTPEPPEGLSSEEFRKKLEGKEGLRVIKVDSTQAGGKFSLSWEVEFDNLAALAALDESDGEAPSMTGQGSPGGMYKDISWQNVGGKMVYSRAVGDQPAGGAPADTMSMSMANMMFAGAAMDYTVHFPGEVSATSGNVVEGEKKSAHWNIPFSQVMQGRTTMTAEVKSASAGIPWLWVGIAAFIVFDVIVMALILAWVMKRRREQAATPVTGSSGDTSVAESGSASPTTDSSLRTPDDDFRPQ